VESESRQNLLPYSIPDSTNWLESESTITENSIVAPDGETTASLITTTGTGPFVANNTLVLSNSLSYVFSAYLKAGTAPYVRLGHQSSAENGAWFDLSNGTIATVNDANNRATIEDVGNGWYRCSLYIATGYGTAANTFIGLSDADNSTTATTGVTCYAWGAQIEQTSGQLSSYIPTAGSAITRAAETLTIPSANLPYPTPNVIGSELVTNGTFDTATDWTLDSGWSISGGKLVGGSGANTTKAYQAISTTAGKVYQISYDVDAVSGTFVLEARQDTSGGAVLAGVTVSSGSNQALFFVAATGTTVVDFNDYGTSITIDNVSVKEIDPLSVSIQMDGRMTYADEGIDGQITQLLWAATSSTRIRNAVSTNTGSGRQDFQQANAGVYDNVLADADYYSPGILVPYNIASRHGSTFVNGAVDGTALTEDTTPVALPDLSSTDLDLAYDYMGTIRTFRIWDADLTDEGIEFVST
jgi:hypothetical protein